MITISKEVELAGTGLHGGRHVNMRLLPGSRPGVVFRRTDLDGLEFSPSPRCLGSGRRTILLRGRHRIQTVEHFLAAVLASGITSLLIEIDMDEVPIFDGSAKPFVEALAAAGLSRADPSDPVLRLLRPFTVGEGAGSITAKPADEFRVSYLIDFDHPAIGTQKMSLAVTPEAFTREIAPARTFGFLSEVPELQRRNLARGGSMENALILDEKGIVNGPLRYPDEFVRHKILDLIGDLALLGQRPAAHFAAVRAGHALHHSVVRFWMDHPDYWETVSPPR
jgi:UDP-3-O-[3-hydroxymyristoyl] N-acetylglucosamine deacetylase